MSTQWAFDRARGLPAPPPLDGFQNFLRRGEVSRRATVFDLQDDYRGAWIRQGLALLGALGLLVGTFLVGSLSWLMTLGLCAGAVALAIYSMLAGLERRLTGEQLAELDTQPAADVWGPPSVLIGLGLAFASMLLAVFKLG